MEVGSSKYIRLCKWPRRDQPWCPGGLGGLHMLRSIKWGPSVSRRKANTTINLSLRSLDVKELHGKTLANAVVEAYTETCVELISVHKEWIKWGYKYLIIWCLYIYIYDHICLCLSLTSLMYANYNVNIFCFSLIIYSQSTKCLRDSSIAFSHA